MAWLNWWKLSEESTRAGDLLAGESCYRSSVSRYYYAAYQTASAMLVALGRTPPAGRQAWSHERTPELIGEALIAHRLLSPWARNQLRSRLRVLYILRITADYYAADVMSDKESDYARRESGILVKVLEPLLPRLNARQHRRGAPAVKRPKRLLPRR